MATEPAISVCVHLEDDTNVTVEQSSAGSVYVSINGKGYPSAALFMPVEKARELASALNAYCATQARANAA